MALGLAPREGNSLPRAATLRLAAHVFGLVVAGAGVGALLGALGAGVAELAGQKAMVGAAGAIAVGYGLADLGVLRLPRAGLARQVPRSWMRSLPAPVAYLLFGLILGSGFLTTSPFATFTAVLFFEFAAATALGGAIIGAAYGLGRGLAVLIDFVEALRVSFSTSFIPDTIRRAPTWRLGIGVCYVIAGSSLLLRTLLA